MGEYTVIKVGGNDLDDAAFVSSFIATVRTMPSPPVIVHGGGKEIAAWQQRLGLEPRFVEGLRVTGDESLVLAEMILSGRVNKRLAAQLVTAGVQAVGISGVDLGLIRVRRMTHPTDDLGWVGEVAAVQAEPLRKLLAAGFLPVVSPISLGEEGHAYNVNADHAALALAGALPADTLVFLTNVPGVLDSGQVISRLSPDEVEQAIADGIVSGGMVPKVRSAAGAVRAGVGSVLITNLAGLQGWAAGGRPEIGTRIS
ncbi:MAG: acetylglutamate kinase [Chloroflexi bacterium]|nr:acetylglutamate kinase [Chloroflexota bacterium]